MEILGYAQGGASKPYAVIKEVGIKNLHGAIHDACQTVGLHAIDTVFVGMGGVISDADAETVRRMLQGLEFKTEILIGIDHDIRIALAGGLGGKPGIALIAGTGSSCYGRTAAAPGCYGDRLCPASSPLSSGTTAGQRCVDRRVDQSTSVERESLLEAV